MKYYLHENVISRSLFSHNIPYSIHLTGVCYLIFSRRLHSQVEFYPSTLKFQILHKCNAILFICIRFSGIQFTV